MRSSVTFNDGVWKGTSAFREEALRFIADGCYCKSVKGSLDYRRYWDVQLERCRNGYKVGNCKITGHHYAYLNFCRIDLIDVLDADGSGLKKEVGFPDFWDWDYEYFWWLEIARFGVLGKWSQAREMLDSKEVAKLEEGGYTADELRELKEDVIYRRLGLRLRTHPDWLDGGHHFMVAKSRRKGFTFKNTAVMCNTYNTERNSQCVFGVCDSKYADQGMKFVGNYLDFFNSDTAWGKRREVHDTSYWKKASFKTQTEDGKVVERGYKSEIICVSFKDNPEAANGKNPYYMFFEEAGVFNNLKASWGATKPSLQAGRFTSGQAVFFGTGGEISDNNGEFSDMFYEPMPYNIMPFKNVWDDGCSGDWCAFFFSAAYNLEGFYDREGNSDVDGALEYLNTERKKILDTSTNIDTYNKYVIQFPLCPKESFKTQGRNVFNVVALESQLSKVRAEKLMFKMGTCVRLSYADDGKKVVAKPVLDGKADPIVEYRHKNRNLTGCPIIYEYPIDDPPFGLYKIGYDPYAQEKADTESLSAILVYKGVMRGDPLHDVIVAEYVGRPDTADMSDEIALKLSILYNTEVMYENNVPHTKSYFERKHRLDRLALQPNRVISKNVKKSRVARVFGCHLDGKMKTAGEEYVKEWLNTVLDYDENGDEITVVDRIYSIGLLEELIKYFRDGNFDRVCALFQIMFQIQDEEIGMEYAPKRANKRVEELMKLKMFSRG